MRIPSLLAALAAAHLAAASPVDEHWNDRRSTFLNTITSASTSSTASTAATATQACTTSPVPNPPAALHCGQYGVLSAPTPLGSPITIRGSAKKPLNTCRNKCLDSRKCISFSFNTQSNQCTFYSNTLNNQGFTKGKSGIIFYNRRCFAISCPSQSASTSSTTTTTTTTVATSTSPSVAACGPTGYAQYVQDSDFSDGPSDSSWTFSSDNGQATGTIASAPDGSYYADLVSSPAPSDNVNLYMSQTPPSITNDQSLYFKYIFRVVQPPANSYSCQLTAHIDNQELSGYNLQGTEDPDTPITMTGFYPAGYNPQSVSAQLQCYDSSVTTEVYIEEFSLVSSESNCPLQLQVVPNDSTIPSPGYLTLSTNGYGWPIAVATADPSASDFFPITAYGDLLNPDTQQPAFGYAGGPTAQVLFNGPNDADNAYSLQLGIDTTQSPNLLANPGNYFSYCPSTAGANVQGLNQVFSGESAPDASCYTVSLAITY